MTWLIIGIIIFFGVHLVPSTPLLRQKLVQRIGEWPYKGIYALLSLAGLVLMVKGFNWAEHILLWQMPVTARYIPAVLMAPSLILLVAALFKNNIKRLVRNPMSWGILLWSVSHLLVNGDLAALVFFGSFALFSLFDMRSAGKRGETAAASPVSIRMDLLAGGIGLMAYFLLVAFHGELFGIPIFL